MASRIRPSSPRALRADAVTPAAKLAACAVPVPSSQASTSGLRSKVSLKGEGAGRPDAESLQAEDEDRESTASAELGGHRGTPDSAASWPPSSAERHRSPDGKLVVSRGYTKEREPVVRLWKTSTGEKVGDFTLDRFFTSLPFRRMASFSWSVHRRGM
jgi:hypothetical protein